MLKEILQKLRQIDYSRVADKELAINQDIAQAEAEIKKHYVAKEEVRGLLRKYADGLRYKREGDKWVVDWEKRPLQKPTHGSCCTCQKCGYANEDCVCTHNKIIDDFNKLEEIKK